MKSLQIIGLCLFSVGAFAQRYVDESSSYSFKDRGYVGFGLSGLNFGNDRFSGRFFSIGGSAQLGYMVTNNLSTGLGFEYTYTTYSDQNIKNHVYGGYPFIRYNIKNFFLQTDYNLVTFKVDAPGQELKASFERFFAGIGYSSPSGNRAFFNILVSYDFLYTTSSPFASPLSIRFYFTLGLSD